MGYIPVTRMVECIIRHSSKHMTQICTSHCLNHYDACHLNLSCINHCCDAMPSHDISFGELGSWAWVVKHLAVFTCRKLWSILLYTHAWLPPYRDTVPTLRGHQPQQRPGSCRQTSPAASSCMRTLDCPPSHGSSLAPPPPHSCAPWCLGSCVL